MRYGDSLFERCKMPLLFIGIIVLAIGLSVFAVKDRQQKIQEWASQQGYRVVSSENMFIGHGPFSSWEIDEDDSVYRVVVEPDTIESTGSGQKVFYVRFGEWSDPTFRPE